MDISRIMDTKINVLDSVYLIYFIETILCLVIFDDVNPLNMMSVVLYNTAHELITKVTKL